MMKIFALATFLLIASSVSAAPLTITDVRVTIGAGLFTPQSVGWSFPVPLATGESLVLAQNGPSAQYPGTGYSFDGSDYFGVPTIRIAFADRPAIAFTDGAYVLSAGGDDPGERGINEASDWVTAYVGDGYLVQLGYGDNTRNCPSFGCFPTSDGTFVQAAGSILQPGLGGPASYFDTSMIKITATSPVPEPASLALLGCGLLCVGYSVRRKTARP